MKAPKVSIGLPVYNGEKFIDKALESILNQDYEDFELIISDNASEDSTEYICRRYAQTDNRIRYSRLEENTGAASNYNRVFRLSRGEYFKWIACDDECHRTFLSRCVEMLESTPSSVAMVYPQAELIDEEGRILGSGSDRIGCKDPRPHRRLSRTLWSLNLCDPVFGLYKREYLRMTQLIGPFFGADNVLLGELAMLGMILEIDQVLFRLRMHSMRSMKANPSARSRAIWYDPAAARKLFILPNWEGMVWELLKSVQRLPLHPTEKLKCALAVPGIHYWRRFRNYGGKLKDQIRGCVER